ncbi:hypothetical protein ACN1S5_002836 [Vibrio cholerae]|uniref:hypothetical protein n=1 Tax=Vibrio cholerae TaxID=666 RepID=UPI00215CE1CB|nr:hypothetical protein [Vibrio cholerae]MCR9398130.1 hypothetical protein [Vibrio cholerae]
MLINKIKNNSSLFIMIVLSGSYFLASLIAKKSLDANGFYIWNAFVTMMAVAFSFCFLGSEQLFIRYGRVKGCIYDIPISVLVLMLSSLVLFSSVFYIVFGSTVFIFDSHAFYFLISLSSAIFVYSYNWFRILGFFNIAQVVNNLWKLLVLLSLIFFSGYETIVIINSALLISCIVCLYCVVKFSNKITFSMIPLPNDWLNIFIGCFSSILIITLINCIDRVLVEKLLSKEDFSNYVYLVTMTILPFSFISTYFGFKEVSLLKNNFNRKVFLFKIKKSIYFVSVLSLFWLSAVLFFSDFIEIKIDVGYIIPLYLSIIAKCVYSYYSSLFGLKARASDMHAANIITFIFILLICYLNTFSEPSVLKILYSSAFFWVLRCYVFSYLLKNTNDY